MVKIQFLGTGNAFCPPNRMHSLVLIDDEILIDVPPTVIPQLRNAGISPSKISTILITHWHGDHTFGLPFLLLDRKYLSDRSGNSNLTIYCYKGGRNRLQNLCNQAYPNTLESLKWLEYNEDNEGNANSWEFSRFEVCHDPATEPHGYLLRNSEGFTIAHCGDSGPCENIEKLAKNTNIMIIEMGIPDSVNSPYHYSPSRLTKLANKNPNTKFIATHNYANSFGSEPESETQFVLEKLPSNVVQAEDGDCYEF
ncbi:MAG: ribonuclease Z [Candidatus Thalassarchaeaceae archaeon]|nr:ribonuclease Z [Candidatus Thalassarchaeaceae archaeon]